MTCVRHLLKFKKKNLPPYEKIMATLPCIYIDRLQPNVAQPFFDLAVPFPCPYIHTLTTRGFRLGFRRSTLRTVRLFLGAVSDLDCRVFVMFCQNSSDLPKLLKPTRYVIAVGLNSYSGACDCAPGLNASSSDRGDNDEKRRRWHRFSETGSRLCKGIDGDDCGTKALRPRRVF